MKMRYIGATLAVLTLAGCKQTEKTEAVVSEIEAAQIDGRNTAKQMQNLNWEDTLVSRAAFRDVDSLSRKYTDPAVAEKFRESFRSTILTLHPTTRTTSEDASTTR